MSVDITQQCFAFTPQANVPAHNLNFSLKVKGSNPGCLLKSFLLYGIIHHSDNFKDFFNTINLQIFKKNCPCKYRCRQIGEDILLLRYSLSKDLLIPSLSTLFYPSLRVNKKFKLQRPRSCYADEKWWDVTEFEDSEESQLFSLKFF